MNVLQSFKDYPHSYDAVAYAYDVTKGHKPACQDERQACQRFIDDLAGGVGYVYDVGRAEKACRFIEKLKHTKGKWAAQGQNLILEPWQKFIVCNLFGWVDDDGKRRFRHAYLKIPRKNGKSLLAAAIGVYMFVADGEFGAEVYSGATTEKQAWEVFGPARLICKRLPTLQERYGVEVNAKNMNVLADASKFEPLIGNPGDGASPSCAIVDEYHEHASSDQVDTMLTGMGAREQPLLLEITTAGNNYSGPCYDAEVEYKKLLAKVYQDDRTFVQIFGIDSEDDWTTEEALIKANPNYDISVSAEFLKAQQEAAKRNPSKQNAFKRKHLNVWVGAANAWINMEDWAQCKDTKMKVEDFKDEPCTVILDLASRLDITAKIKLWAREVGGKKHYYVFPTFYLPEETVHDGGNDHYQSWVNAGHMIATDGEEIDFNEIEADVEKDLGDFDMREVVYDPWRAVQLAQGLAERGALTVEWRGKPANNSPPMRELEAAITGKRLHHPDNPVLNWMASNIVAKEGASETLMPKKEKPENKIDGIVAIIMGVGRLMHEEPMFDVDAMLASEPVRVY